MRVSSDTLILRRANEAAQCRGARRLKVDGVLVEGVCDEAREWLVRIKRHDGATPSEQLGVLLQRMAHVHLPHTHTHTYSRHAHKREANPEPRARWWWAVRW
jgi:hypothetical protein